VVYYKALLRGLAAHFEQNLETPWKSLPEDFRRVVLHGSGEVEVSFNFMRAGKVSKLSRPFEGVLKNLERLYAESESEFTKNRLKAFMAPEFCDACGGRRLRPEVLAVTLGNAESEHGAPIPHSALAIPHCNDPARQRANHPAQRVEPRARLHHAAEGKARRHVRALRLLP
jgi:excinuclease ABC subunit A